MYTDSILSQYRSDEVDFILYFQKSHHFYLLDDSVTRQPILIRFGVQHPEETCYKFFF